MPKTPPTEAEGETPSTPDFSSFTAKFDSMQKQLDEMSKVLIALKPKEDTTTTKPPEKPKEILAAEVAFRSLLADAYPKEKLDAWGLSELTLAHDVKSNFKPKNNKDLPDPPIGKKDADKEKPVPPWLYARPELVNNTEGGKP